MKFGDTQLKDTMLEDGLMDAFNRIHMGVTGLVVEFHKINCLLIRTGTHIGGSKC